jgi:hypothetical protein
VRPFYHTCDKRNYQNHPRGHSPCPLTCQVVQMHLCTYYYYLQSAKFYFTTFTKCTSRVTSSNNNNNNNNFGRLVASNLEALGNHWL